MRIILKYEKYQCLWKPHKYWVCREMPILLGFPKIVGVKFESPPLRSENPLISRSFSVGANFVANEFGKMSVGFL